MVLTDGQTLQPADTLENPETHRCKSGQLALGKGDNATERRQGSLFNKWGWGDWTFLGESTAVLGIKPVNPKENQPWIFIRKTDDEAEAPILWPTDAKSQLIGSNPVAGKDWGQEEKGVTEDEIIGWHHQLNGHEFEQTLGDGDGQGSLLCSSPWGLKELDTT